MRLLLVEDDVMVASGIKLGLSDAGYAVDWVGSAERALEVTQAETFDVAVVDIGLPRMDGLALDPGPAQRGPHHAGADPHRARCPARPGAGPGHGAR